MKTIQNPLTTFLSHMLSPFSVFSVDASFSLKPNSGVLDYAHECSLLRDFFFLYHLYIAGSPCVVEKGISGHNYYTSLHHVPFPSQAFVDCISDVLHLNRSHCLFLYSLP